jgi:nucleoside phosphorylase
MITYCTFVLYFNMCKKERLIICRGTNLQQKPFKALEQFYSEEETGMPDGGTHRAVVLTAIRIEYQAVRAHLTNLRQEIHPSGTIYERGNFTAHGQSWDVLIVETGSGNTKATAETVRAIEHFKPGVAIFIGVAGGLKDVQLCVVVAATRVYGYESGKTDQIFRSRPDVRSSTHRMEQRARAEAKKEDWLKRLSAAFFEPVKAPRVHIAPIASGNQVVASTSSAVLDLIRSHYNDAVAIEMEGYGFLEAVHAYPRVEALIIRGISDLIDDKTDADARKYQEVAARHASAFAFEILAKLDAERFQEAGQGTSKVASLGEGWQVDKVSQLTTTTSEGLQTPSSIVFLEGLLQEFRTTLPEYTGKIARIRDFFDEGRDIFPDRYKSASKSLDGIEKHVQMLCKHATELSFYDRARLFTIRNQIRALKSELRKFHLPRWLKGTSRQRRGDESNRESISTKCQALLTNLEQF